VTDIKHGDGIMKTKKATGPKQKAAKPVKDIAAKGNPMAGRKTAGLDARNRPADP